MNGHFGHEKQKAYIDPFRKSKDSQCTRDNTPKLHNKNGDKDSTRLNHDQVTEQVALRSGTVAPAVAAALLQYPAAVFAASAAEARQH